MQIDISSITCRERVIALEFRNLNTRIRLIEICCFKTNSKCRVTSPIKYFLPFLLNEPFKCSRLKNSSALVVNLAHVFGFFSYINLYFN